ncbi:MAG: diaminopimelate decarboxylase [Cyanobacteria bacterium P01_A01_bin.135]
MVSTPTARAHQSGLDFLSPPLTSEAANRALLPLTARRNDLDHLEVGGCDVVELVKAYGSPLYILDESTLRRACQQYRDAFETHYPGDSLVIYASKAWNCLGVCAIVASEGLGIDVVSGGELFTALESGFEAEKIYFHGNNKSQEEIEFALSSQVTLVVDNWLELKTLAAMTADSDAPVPVLLRMTPGIECHTHEYIQTGHLDSKFGFDPNQLTALLDFFQQTPQLACIGLHAHIGSQIFELQPHQDLPDVMVRWLATAAQQGMPVKVLDIGGGLGIRYTPNDDPPTIEAWVQTVCEAVTTACQAHGLPLPKLIAEPGRSLIGSACVTAYTIGSQKTVPDTRTYITVDGGMSDNPRPITYQSDYCALIANRLSAPCRETVTVAGKHCESGDVLIRDIALPTTDSGDILVVMGTGAYNYSMASNYNRIPRPAAVVVNDGSADLILQRETYRDLVQHDRLPSRLTGGS